MFRGVLAPDVSERVAALIRGGKTFFFHVMPTKLPHNPFLLVILKKSRSILLFPSTERTKGFEG